MMERFTTYVVEANKAFKIADHLIYVTYPVLQDNKLLATALEHLAVALQKGMEALLYYDALYKRISAFPTVFSSQWQIFKQGTAKRHNISERSCEVIRDVVELIENRRDSPVEFSRKDKYVFASESYKLRTLTHEKMKSYINEGKSFLQKVNDIHATHDRRLS
jgi:hypothetical protein